MNDNGNMMIDPDPILDPHPNDIENPFESLATAMVTWVGDWSMNERLAWTYGIVIGWDETIHQVAARHGWTPATVRRLKRLRIRYKNTAKTFEL